MSRGLCCRASVTSLMAELGWGRKGWEGEEGMGKWDGRDQPHCPPRSRIDGWSGKDGEREWMDWEGEMDGKDGWIIGINWWDGWKDKKDGKKRWINGLVGQTDEGDEWMDREKGQTDRKRRIEG